MQFRLLIISRINFDLQLIKLLNFGAVQTQYSRGKETSKYSFNAENFMEKFCNLDVCNFETKF